MVKWLPSARLSALGGVLARRILLVEPAYKSSYPPLGLMKLAAYHKQQEDEVRFVRGCDHSASIEYWDRIYITSLFTYDWAKVIAAVKFYKDNLFGSAAGRLFVGGIAATLLPDQLYNETGLYPIRGPLMTARQIDEANDTCIDELVPDYSILSQVAHEYRYGTSFIGRTTRGCIRRCSFCAVPTIEPENDDYLDFKPSAEGIKKQIGDQAELLLLDNNVLSSARLVEIVDDLVALGFSSGAKINGRMRTVDFNQGLDARLINEQTAEQLARLPLKPVRIAYDRSSSREVFEKAVRQINAVGFTNLSNYMLYNFDDEPVELWERIHHCVELSEELGIKIWSFPMRYIPITDTTRGHVGPHWNRRLLRGVQCVSLVTRGAISARHDFFHKAFGDTPEKFTEILSMPDRYIIQRAKHEGNGASEWRGLYEELTSEQRNELWSLTSRTGCLQLKATLEMIEDKPMRDIVSHYVEYRWR